jgi:RNA polymerase sigma-70 factor, ECF subfamily
MMAQMARSVRTPPLLVARLTDDRAEPQAAKTAPLKTATPGFDALYAAQARYVAGLAGRLLGRDDDVADVVQDVFLIAHRSLGALREPGAARGWLARVTVRVASRRLRKRRLRSFLRLGMTGDCDLVVDSRATPEIRPLAALLYAALDRMPTRYRLPWILRHLADQTLETVADSLGSSPATVKRRIAVAERRLRPLLGDEPAGPKEQSR